LAIASTLGYRDCNEASWTSVTDAVERIVDCSGLPVLVDGDTGFEIDQASADPVDLGYRP
jgi:phosphoenolpyruvate phosphomutase